jgi:hypothetical protein
VRGLDRARDAIDLVEATVDAAVGIVEHAIVGDALRLLRDALVEALAPTLA